MSRSVTRANMAEREATVDVSMPVFTTGQAAALCWVCQQTMIRMFDAGHLKGFRVPGSVHRRIPRAALVAFMRANGIPLGRLADATPDGRATDVE